MSKRIQVRVKPDGSFEIEAHGFQSKECTVVSKDLLSSLGVHQEDIELKPEAFLEDQVNRDNEIQGGI